jgi:aminoglycoside/choline kinase family phosphotransferase
MEDERRRKEVRRDPDPKLREFAKAFVKAFGFPTVNLRFEPLQGDGSQRRFWRVAAAEDGESYIAMENPPSDEDSRRENLAYLMIGKHLFDKGLPIPQIHRYDLEQGWFILQDCGDRNLQDVARHSRDRIPVYERVVEILFRLQIEGSQGFEPSWCCQTSRYDQRVMRVYEANYFRDAFLRRYLGLKADWPELEAPFEHLIETASAADDRYYLHRDFQSRNIMVSDDGIGVIDWQGGRLGPLAYDLASLLIDPYTALSDEERNRVFECYLRLVQSRDRNAAELLGSHYPYLAIQRNLQILGAFSFLTRVRGKIYFEAYIPPALDSLRRLLDELQDPKLSPLLRLVRSLDDLTTGAGGEVSGARKKAKGQRDG